MDLKVYYQKIREKRATITDPYPVVVSNETADGGKPGVLSEVTPDVAAKMLVDGTARMATAQEIQAFREDRTKAKRAADDAQAASKVQLTVVSKEMLEQLHKKG